MSKIKPQLGTAITADLHENTWTFKMYQHAICSGC